MKRHLAIGLMAVVMACSAQAESYRNPVIAGYHPDPSVCRVGDDFYLVNSSFQYFPGVPVYHSKDLVNWQLVGNVLDRDSQLPLKGASSWLGIYAPTIRYHEGKFYMITTNVGNGGNFLVTATDPRGPWSEPVWLKQQGIDPSLYWENGRCYMVSNPDDGIWLCEIDEKTGEQLSSSQLIWRGTGGRYPEGPHLYKKDGYYYLLISEGGTELAHKLTIARSRNIAGPYESNPANPILTNCCQKGQTKQIQGTGHGDLVEAADGSWWMVLLAYRNFGGSYHHLGRETYLAPVEWPKGEWPVVNGGEPIDTVMTATLLAALVPNGAKGRRGTDTAQSAPEGPRNGAPMVMRTTFDRPLGPEWLYLQNPLADRYEMAGGRLTMKSHGTLDDNNQPTYVGRRQESPRVVVETEVDAQQGRGGITVYQINDGHIDCYVENGYVRLRCRLKSLMADCGSVQIDGNRARIRMETDGEMYRFACAGPDGHYRDVGAANCSLVSTEVAGGFTGVTIGMFAEDGTSSFGYFNYAEQP